ncbi:hypothetical protein PTKIN_Ptkin11bG0164600 [Pterospermum kingtungense]
MELVAPIFEVIKSFARPTMGYIKHCRKLQENVDDLTKKMKALNDRKQDLELRKETEVRCRKVVKKEVDNWFEDVLRINAEVEEIEEKFQVVSCFSRGRLGKLVSQKIKEVKAIYQQGSFPEGVAVDGPPAIGVTLPTTRLEGEIEVKGQIWENLMGDEVGMIGVCGMGGIGKTTIMKHINNQLLKECDQFEKMIWITVSKELNIFKLQEDLAKCMGVEFLSEDDELKRATILMDILERKRFVLILDDVWKRFSLLEVGVPTPTLMGRGSKIVLTSRSIEVCKSMDCEVIKVQPLSREESKSLFLDHVGRNVLQNQELENVINLIVEQCGGLPLAIVTIAGSLKGEDELYVWRNALNELEERVKSVKGSDVEIFERLKFSYDRLGDVKIRFCFLYCSLYPEDRKIETAELIENWIEEGLLDGLKTRQAMYDRGHSIINKLENNCLLERDRNDYFGEYVKMHDVLRDMALYIKSEGPQFMVKAGMQLKELPGEQEWTINLEKVSLMHNSISGEIPLHLTPRCPHLSTLLLQGNSDLRSIPDSFFEQMPGLKVLNLSCTKITVLPESISNLKNLNALILAHCYKLTNLPSLVELRGLRKLDLFLTGIEEIPHGVDMLENLTYLRLCSTKLIELPVGILPKMFDHLQCLVICRMYLMGKEVGQLRKLEILSCSFRDLYEFEIYAKSIQGKWPTNFHFTVGYLEFSLELQFINNLEKLQRNIKFLSCDMEKTDLTVVPNGIATLCIEECGDFKCLSRIPLFHEASRCEIKNCRGVEFVVDLSLSSCNTLQNIEELILRKLDNLIELVRGRIEVVVAVESTSHAPTPPAIFSSLKELNLNYCLRIKKLFPVKLLQGLKNLERLVVYNCEKLEEIIASEENEEENHNGGGSKIILPKLKSFFLDSLRKLKSICSSGVVIQADSLQYVGITSCPELKRIPLALPLFQNGKPYAPPFLEEIKVSSREWWESLEWDQPFAKDVLSPFLY